MDDTTFSRMAAIQTKQSDQLFSRLKYSASGSAIIALVMDLIIGPKTNQSSAAWFWFIAIFLVSFYRWLSANIYNRLDEAEKLKHNWRFRFNIGAYLAAIAWIQPMWLFYPVGYPEYQVLMLLGLAGIVGGSLAILSYDKKFLVDEIIFRNTNDPEEGEIIVKFSAKELLGFLRYYSNCLISNLKKYRNNNPAN